MLTKIMPELPSDDVAAAIAHYRDVLGFRVNYEQGDIGVMDRDAVVGPRDFHVVDLDDNRLTFGQPLW